MESGRITTCGLQCHAWGRLRVRSHVGSTRRDAGRDRWRRALKKNFGLPTPLTVYKGVETYQRFLCLAASVSGTYWAGKCSANYRRCTHHDTEQLGTSDLAVLVFVN